MPEETTLTTENESTAEVSQATSEPVVEDNPAADAPESALSPDDVWENKSLFLKVDEQSDIDKDDADTKGDDKTPPDSLPSDAVADTPPVETTDTDKPDEEDQTDEEDEPVTEVIEPTVARLSRKELREVEKAILIPFRDPEAPVEAVVEGLFNLHPSRAMDMASFIINQSVREQPDQWLNTLLGTEGLSVDAVKRRIESNGNYPDADDATASTATLTSLEQQPHVRAVVNQLNQVYGESWRDAANDGMLLLEDQDHVKAFRAMLAQAEAERSEKEQLKAEIASLKPQIDQLKTNDELELDNKVTAAYQTTVTEYRKTVEDKSLSALLPQLGFEISPDDTPEVKAVKEFAKARFQSVGDEGSDLDDFIAKESPDREMMTKIVLRVDKNLKSASEAEVKASRTKDATESATLKAQAQSYRAEAMREQDRIIVLYNKAAKLYAEQKLAPIMAVLEQNADLQRRLNVNTGGRTEIVGSAAVAANGHSWRESITAQAKQGTNPFDLDVPLIRGEGR